MLVAIVNTNGPNQRQILVPSRPDFGSMIGEGNGLIAGAAVCMHTCLATVTSWFAPTATPKYPRSQRWRLAPWRTGP